MKICRVLATLVCTCAAGVAAADDMDQLMLASCTGCHVPDSRVLDAPPPVFGRPARDLVDLLQGFKQGQREATVMDRIARGYTDDELVLLAQALERNPLE